jgi:hypothetical protein
MNAVTFRSAYPDTHWTGSRFVVRTGLDVAEKRKISCLYRNSNSARPSCYTDWVIAAPVMIMNKHFRRLFGGLLRMIEIHFCIKVKGLHYSEVLTGSLWRRQSQQSFNTLTPFNLIFYSLHVSAPTGHPQVRYTISYYFCFWRTILIQRIRCTY